MLFDILYTIGFVEGIMFFVILAMGKLFPDWSYVWSLFTIWVFALFALLGVTAYYLSAVELGFISMGF